MKIAFYKISIGIVFLFAGWSCSKESAADASASSTGQGGSLSKITIVGNYLYGVDSRYLYTFDISNPVEPIKINSVVINFNVETIFPFGSRLFIGTSTGMFIFSLDDPAKPAMVGQAQHLRSCDPVVANDSFAFVTLKGNSFCGSAESGLYAYDIKNVFNPQLKKIVPIASPEGLGLNGSTLYICCNNDGLKVFDVSAPSHPIVLKTISGAYFKDVIPYGNLLICYVSTGIKLYDISNPVDPVFIKTIEN